MKTSDFDYYLPPEFIAQTPVEPRDHSRLMVLRRDSACLEHRYFYDIIHYLRPGDVLVMNDSRVIPARLRGRKIDTGASVEMLLLHQREPGVWEVLLRPGKRVKEGTRIAVTGASAAGTGVIAEVRGSGQGGVKVVTFSNEGVLPALGEVPLPPYIHTPLANPGRYQTVYARTDGSAAAPTAGLHFTPELLEKVKEKGVEIAFVTLHIGLDTFQPVREEDPAHHRIHREYACLDQSVARQLSRAKNEGRRIICVGTTSVRIVEQAAGPGSPARLRPFTGWADLFILPGYRFRVVDALITNFHLPRSTLLMLVSAFAGTDFTKKAYAQAIADRYRFYSFGDAMLIL